MDSRCRASRTSPEGYIRLSASLIAALPAELLRGPALLRQARTPLLTTCSSHFSLFFRSLFVSFIFYTYILSSKDKQSTFTGGEQRLRVWVLPFLFDGLFDRGKPKQGKVADTASDVEVPDSTDADAGDSGTSGGLAQFFLQNILGEDGGGDDAPSAENDEPERAAANVGADKEDKKAAQSNARLDWAAYREAFPDTPPHAAITAMFAEYALLVGRITRKLGVATVTPMTMREGEELATQAHTFVLRYVTPILGPLHTTMVHKLLCHLLDAVRLHENILNGDTSTNEQEHKEGKRDYPRTNKSSSGYMRQLVRHASGLRVISRRNKALRAGQASGAATAASNADGYEADGESVEEDTDDGTGAVVVPSPAVYGRGGAAAASEGAELNPAAAADRQLGPVGAHLSAAAVADLATQPGLGDIGPLLRLDSGDEVRVPSHLHFTARTPGRCDERYLVRASPNYRGAPWHDHVAYQSVDSLPSGPERFGRVLLLIRQEDCDFAVVAQLIPVEGEEGPLSSRGCTPLRWEVQGDSETGCRQVRLAKVPVENLLRVVHVVPHFADLFLRRGVGATPGELGDEGAALSEQRFLLNAFFPFAGVRRCRKRPLGCRCAARRHVQGIVQ